MFWLRNKNINFQFKYALLSGGLIQIHVLLTVKKKIPQLNWQYIKILSVKNGKEERYLVKLIE